MIDVVRAHGRRGVHPADRRRRHPHRRGHARDAARRRGQGLRSIRPAVARPEVIARGVRVVRRPGIVLSMDVLWNGSGFYEIVTHGGRRPTGMDAIEWAQRGVEAGRGRDRASTASTPTARRMATSCKLTRLVSDAVTVPVVASGGAGNADHMCDVLTRARRTRRWRPASSTSAPHGSPRSRRSWPSAACRCARFATGRR